MRIEYSATRNIMSGHTLNNVYDYDYDVESARKSVEINKSTPMSLSGKVETHLNGYNTYWDVTTTWINRTNDLPQWEELMDSTLGGEAILFDPWGTLAVPSAGYPVTAIIMSNSWALNMVTYDEMTISFRVKEA